MILNAYLIVLYCKYDISKYLRPIFNATFISCLCLVHLRSLVYLWRIVYIGMIGPLLVLYASYGVNSGWFDTVILSKTRSIVGIKGDKRKI